LGVQAKAEVPTKGNESKIIKSNDFKTIVDPKNIPTNNTKDTVLSKNVSSNNSEIKSSLLKEIQSLLGSDEKGESTLISNELLNNFSADQMKNLIHRAKEYLKNEITAKNPDYQVDSKSLPKTLAGLVKLAEKLDLSPQSITLSTLISDTEEKAKLPTELLSKPLLEIKALSTLSIAIQEESPMEAITLLLSEIKAKEQKTPKPTSSASSAEFSEKEVTGKVETQPLKALLQNMDKREAGSTVATATETVDPAKTTTVSFASHTKAEALISLLHGNIEQKESKTESANSLKVEGESPKALHTPKADSLEVKSKEAQQSMRLFASDLKEAVQEYKPPFTR
jgi:flagellar hook-length control protein FliK